MSSLWTPGGEHDVPRDRPTGAGRPESRPGGPAGRSQAADYGADHDTDDEAALAALREELASVPAEAVVANHCLGLFQLAAIHLSLQPPNTEDARLAIDAMGALVDGLRGRLGPEEPTLIEALAQLKLAFVQIMSAAAPPGGPAPGA